MALSSTYRNYIQYGVGAICVMYMVFPSPLPTNLLPLFLWAIILAVICAYSYYNLASWAFMMIVFASIFAVHVTRQYVMYLKQPVGIYDLTQFNANVLPTSRTQSVFSPAPALTADERKTYLESLKHAPRNLGGNDFSEKTLEETMVEELTPLGKSFLLPTNTFPSVPGLYLGTGIGGKSV